jgi:hypothetical protein
MDPQASWKAPEVGANVGEAVLRVHQFVAIETRVRVHHHCFDTIGSHSIFPEAQLIVSIVLTRMICAEVTGMIDCHFR